MPRGASALELVDRIVVADDADDLHRVQSGSPTLKERAGAAEHVGGLAERREDGIQRDAADDENGHHAGHMPVQGADDAISIRPAR